MIGTVESYTTQLFGISYVNLTMLQKYIFQEQGL